MEENDTTTDVVPALFEQTLEVYEKMKDDSEYQMVGEEQVLVYEGFLTKLITEELHYSNPYYTKITRSLKQMDCIRQLRRGGSTSPSKWALVQTPTLELFHNAKDKSVTTRSSRIERVEQSIRDLNERLNRAGL